MQADEAVEAVPSPPRTPKKRGNGYRRALLVGGPALVALAGFVLYLPGGRYVSTDDAYVQAARVEISANISARVIEVGVRDNQTVHAGQVLFKLDPRRFEIAVADAKAQLAVARLKIQSLQAAYRPYQAVCPL